MHSCRDHVLDFMQHDDIRIVTYSLKILSLLGRHDPKLLESLVNLDAGV